MKRSIPRTLSVLLLAAVLTLTACGGASAPGSGVPAQNPEETAPRSSREILEELLVDYAGYGTAADSTVDALLAELKAADSDAGERWAAVLELWRSVNAGLALHYDVLPEGLDDTDALCLVVLGFQLKPDGTMREELIERLKVVLASAQRYPNALVVCTGGGTAAENPEATEAGRMAEWLVENGLDAERVIVEDRSLTTAQNAMYTLEILRERYPQVTDLAIISSDYHIATGTLLFGAQALLEADDGTAPFSVVSNAAYKAPSGTLSPMFQAGALIELSGDVETAYKIYFNEYDIHELPPLRTE